MTRRRDAEDCAQTGEEAATCRRDGDGDGDLL
jgi:hypothetical protein